MASLFFSFSDNIVAQVIKRYNIGFVINNQNFKKTINKFLNMNFKANNKINNNCKYLFNNFFELKKNTSILEKIIKTGLNK